MAGRLAHRRPGDVAAGAGPTPVRLRRSRWACSVPTSCIKQGKCRECLVEIESGAESADRARATGSASATALPARLPDAALWRAQRARCAATPCAAARCGSRPRSRGLDGGGCGTRSRGDPRRRHRAARRRAAGRQRRARCTGWRSTSARPRSRCGSTTSRPGRSIATQSFENPQRFGGSDVMARIRYDGEQPGRLLQRTLRRLPRPRHRGAAGRSSSPSTRWWWPATRRCATCSSASTCSRSARCRTAPRPRRRSAGRRCRHHQPDTHGRGGCGCQFIPQARVYGLPLIGSHVGADAAACLLAIGIAERDGLGMRHGHRHQHRG